MQRGFNECVIDTDRTYLDAEFFNPKFLYEVLLNGLSRLRAQSTHAVLCVITRKRGQVHARDCTQKPSGLPLFFHGATSYLRLGTAFYGAGVHANALHPIQVEGNARV